MVKYFQKKLFYYLSLVDFRETFGFPDFKSKLDNYKSPDFFFVQIGANDGIMFDPLIKYIRRYKWKGILVEPVKTYYKALQKTHRKRPYLVLEHAAISNKNTSMTMYKINEDAPDAPAWLRGVASFSKDNFKKHAWAYPDIAKYIDEEKVACLTLKSLLNKHKVDKIDLMVVDVEGHEIVILKQLAKLQVKPRMLIYEHKHLSKKHYKEAKDMLKKLGYTLEKHRTDMMAYKA